MGLFIAVPLFLQLLVQRDKRLKWLVGLGGLIAGITLLFTLSDLLALAPHVQKIAPHWQATLERELQLFQQPIWIAYLIRGAILLVSLLWLWQERRLTLAWWGMWLTAVLILTPYARGYDGVLLLPLFALMIKNKVWLFVAYVLLMGGYIMLPMSELGSVVAPLVAWLLFVDWRFFMANLTQNVTLSPKSH